jgi:hypothetical protein
MKETSFNAPWGAPLVVMTVACAAICLFLPVLGVTIILGKITAASPWTGWTLIAVPLLTVAVSAAFMVRGYVLTDASLIIKRLGWESRLDLSRLISATVDPDAFHGSIRLFGNGGFFSFTGWFRNKKLGVYRAFATDAKRAVVLRFSGKPIVITPDDPQKFAVEINSRPGQTQ